MGAFRSNFGVVRDLVGPNREILACVKADAYGHGLVACATAALDSGADALGVARLQEAAALRDDGISARIVTIAPEGIGSTEDLVALDVEIAVDSIERADAVAKAALSQGRRARVHLAVDTGMGRFEASPGDAWHIAERIVDDASLAWAGVMTHFAVADADIETTRAQWGLLVRTLAEWTARGIDLPCVHAANSAAILAFPDSYGDMVRPGLMLYGMQPRPDARCDLLRPVLTLRSEISALHRHAVGESIGYGRSFSVERESMIATLPVGYGDGLPWGAGNRAWVLVGGRRVPVVGRLSMDQTTVDVTDVDGASLGDEVVLLGEQGAESVSAEEWATWAGTINYEITTQMLPRVARTIVGG